MGLNLAGLISDDNIARCSACGNPIDQREAYFTYRHGGDLAYSHMRCRGIEALVEAWGLMLRLDRITDFNTDG